MNQTCDKQWQSSCSNGHSSLRTEVSSLFRHRSIASSATLINLCRILWWRAVYSFLHHSTKEISSKSEITASFRSGFMGPVGTDTQTDRQHHCVIRPTCREGRITCGNQPDWGPGCWADTGQELWTLHASETVSLAGLTFLTSLDCCKLWK